MRAVERWFRKQGRRRDRAVYLEEALLGDSFSPYAAYRLRFFFGRTCFALVLHVVEFLFLSYMFSEGALLIALAARASTSFLNAWWWGGLENMRETIRELHREGRRHVVPRYVSRWMGISKSAAATVLALVTTGLFLDVLRPGSTFTPLHFYVLANGVRLALSFVARTYHSGIYAVRRIYRPFMAVIGIHLCGFVGAILLWPYLGPWCFPLMLIVAACLSTMLTFVYTGRVYRFLGLNQPSRGRGPTSGRLLNRRFLQAGLASALMRLDGVLIVAMFHWARPDTPEYAFFLAIYLCGPLVRGSSDWAQLFYFDLKRLEVDLFTRFRLAFERRVASLSLLVAVVLWGLAVGTTTLLLQKNLGLLYPLLGAFLLARSRLAFEQVRAFSERDYGGLVVSGLVIAAGTLLASVSVVERGADSFLLLVACFLGAHVFLSWRKGARGPDGPSHDLQQAWIRDLARVREPVRVRAIEVNPTASDWQLRGLSRAIAKRMKTGIRLTTMSGRRIVWYGGSSDSDEDREWLAVRGSSVIRKVRETPLEEDGMRALLSAQRSGLLGPGIRTDWLEDPPRFRLDQLKERFQRTFPSGVACFVGIDGNAPMRDLSPDDRHGIFHGAFRYARNFFQPAGRGRFEVTSLCDKGGIRAIFAAHRSEDRRKRRQWRAFINSVNLHDGVRRVVEEVSSGMRFVPSRRALVWLLSSVAVTLLLGLVKVQDRATGSFTLKLAERAELRAPAAGFLRAVHFEEGDLVREGEAVTHLEIPDLSGRLRRLQAEQASLDTILHDLRRQGEPPRPQDWARIAGLNEEIRYLEDIQEKLVLRSPVTGIVTTPHLDQSIGRYFLEGEAICEIQDPTVLEAEISLLENRVERVNVGQEIELKALALPFETFHATVDRIAPKAVMDQLETTTVTVYCSPSEQADRLKPGMTGHARILTGRRPLGRILADRFLRFVRTEFWW